MKAHKKSYRYRRRHGQECLCRRRCTGNNVHRSRVLPGGKTVLQTSSGAQGRKGAQRGTNHAAERVGLWRGTEVQKQGIRWVHVLTKGHWGRLRAARKGLQKSGCRIRSVTERTPQAFNGCRRRKERRK